MSIFSVHADSDDVEVVLHEVADALRRWEGGAAVPLDLSLLQGREDQLLQKARQLRLQSNVDGNVVIHSTRPRIGPWIIRFQHLIRRITWWFTEPILQQVRAFQMNTARVVEGLAENQEAMLVELQRLSQTGDAEQLAELRAQIADLREQLGRSTGRNDN